MESNNTFNYKKVLRKTKRNELKNIIKHTTPARIFFFVFLMVLCLFYIFLLVWGMYAALKTRTEFIKNSFAWPKDFIGGLNNYSRAWKTMKAGGNSVPTMVFNAVWYAFGVIGVSSFGTIAFAYVMARFDFPLKKTFNAINIFYMMFPIMGSLPAMMKLILTFGIYDNPLYLLTSVGGFGGGLMIYRVAFRNVPWEFAESAYIDGASHFRVFIQIMFPQIIPLAISQWIGTFGGVWGDAVTPILYMPSYPTLASGLYTYQIEMERVIDTPMLFAGCIISAIPSLFLFLIGKKFMMNINLSGGLKG